MDSFRTLACNGSQGRPPREGAFDIVIWAGTDTETDPVHRAKNTLAGGNIVVHKK